MVLGRAEEEHGGVNDLGGLQQIPLGSAHTTESLAKALKRCDRSPCSDKELFDLLRHWAKLVAVPFAEVPLPADAPSHRSNYRFLCKSSASCIWARGVRFRPCPCNP